MKKYYVGPNGMASKEFGNNNFAIYYDGDYSILIYSTHQKLEDADNICELMNKNHTHL